MKKLVWESIISQWKSFPVIGHIPLMGRSRELEYENFNAATAKVRFFGRNIHTGYAKGKMLNALTLACEFQQVFPVDEVPEKPMGKRAFII